MPDADPVEQLKRLGLSEKEISTYLTVLNLGEAKLTTVAEHADPSKRHLYKISEKLEDRGLVEFNDHVRPATLRAIPPEEAISDLVDTVESLRPTLNAEYSATTRGDSELEVLKSPSITIDRIRQYIRDAEEEVVLSLPRSVLDEVRDELRTAVDGGVLVLLLLVDTESEDVDVPREEVEDVATVARVWSEQIPLMLAVDNSVGVIMPYEVIARSRRGESSIILGREHFVPVLVGAFMGNYWWTAEQFHVVEPAGLPREYSNIRHVVVQACLHERAGTELRASVEGYWVEDGSAADLEGRVTTVTQAILEPTTSELPSENSIELELDDGRRVTVGGAYSFLEGVEARRIELREA